MRQVHVVLGLGILALLLGATYVPAAGKGQDPASKLFARAKADDFAGESYCADCHTDKVKNFKASPHAAFMEQPGLPLNKQGCEGCHGPGKLHQDEENPEVIAFRKMEPADSAAACLRCHEKTLSETHWKRTAHAAADLSCVSCHQIHPDSERTLEEGTVKKGKAADFRSPLFAKTAAAKRMLKADEKTLCGQCHAPELAQFKLNSHHPVPEGAMACSDCHSVHPAKDGKSNQAQIKKTMCTKCHQEQSGPFVHEHEPIVSGSGEECVECHKPHGSQNPKLLNAFSRGVCAQCHTDKLARHYPGRSCWSAGCHVAVHGSNTDPTFLKR